MKHLPIAPATRRSQNRITTHDIAPSPSAVRHDPIIVSHHHPSTTRVLPLEAMDVVTVTDTGAAFIDALCWC